MTIFFTFFVLSSDGTLIFHTLQITTWCMIDVKTYLMVYLRLIFDLVTNYFREICNRAVVSSEKHLLKTYSTRHGHKFTFAIIHCIKWWIENRCIVNGGSSLVKNKEMTMSICIKSVRCSKLVPAIFFKFLFFHQIIALQKY